MFGSPVENITNRELGVAGVMAWYAGESLTVASTVPIALPKNVPTSEPDSETSSGESSSNNQLILIIAAIAVIVVLGFVRVAKTR